MEKLSERFLKTAWLIVQVLSTAPLGERRGRDIIKSVHRIAERTDIGALEDISYVLNRLPAIAEQDGATLGGHVDKTRRGWYVFHPTASSAAAVARNFREVGAILDSSRATIQEALEAIDRLRSDLSKHQPILSTEGEQQTLGEGAKHEPQ